MKYYSSILLLVLAFRASAQLSVGNGGLTVLTGTPVAIDGLTLTPANTLTMVSNRVQKINAPVAGSPDGSISRAYQFGAPLSFSGTVGVFYSTSELNGHAESTLQLAYSSVANGPFTIATGSLTDVVNHYIVNQIPQKDLYVVTVTALPDLTPILYARPSIIAGTSEITLVVDVVELNSVLASRAFSVYIPRDSKVSFGFDSNLTILNSRSIQNGSWNFDSSNPAYYILTPKQDVAAGQKLSFGLNGALTPGATSGVLTVSSTILAGTLIESRSTNNIDADKIDYFQQ